MEGQGGVGLVVDGFARFRMLVGRQRWNVHSIWRRELSCPERRCMPDGIGEDTASSPHHCAEAGWRELRVEITCKTLPWEKQRLVGYTVIRSLEIGPSAIA
jgi:hypothetical protein